MHNTISPQSLTDGPLNAAGCSSFSLHTKQNAPAQLFCGFWGTQVLYKGMQFCLWSHPRLSAHVSQQHNNSWLTAKPLQQVCQLTGVQSVPPVWVLQSSSQLLKWAGEAALGDFRLHPHLFPIHQVKKHLIQLRVIRQCQADSTASNHNGKFAVCTS